MIGTFATSGSAEQIEEAAHHRLAVDQAVVETDVDDVGAVLDLLAGDFDGGLEIAGADELGELRRAGDVRRARRS